MGVLFGEQEGHAFACVKVADDLENLLDDLRRQPHRGFVEQHHLRLRHQGAAERAHLLLAARGVARDGAAPFLQSRKIPIDAVEVAPDRGAAVAAREGAGEQVFLDRQVGEAMAALHHLDAAAAHQFVGRQRLHLAPSNRIEPLVTSPRSAAAD